MNNLTQSNLLYRLKRLFLYGIISFIITSLVVLIRHRYQFDQIQDIPLTIYFGILFGLLLGIVDDIMRYSSISKWQYIYRTIIKTLSIPFIVWLIILVIALFHNLDNTDLFNDGKEDTISSYFIHLIESHVILDVFIVAFMITIFNEINLILGDSFIYNYIIGNVKGPVKEERIFMFLDLKDSTTIAEEIGDIKFYELLNDCYITLGKVTIARKAEIVKYVGDEAILTWTYKDGEINHNCINVLFDFKKTLEYQKSYFLEKYGLFPRFSASAHLGQVISAYLGGVKKQKDYSGDVMNTTARIEGLTTQYNAELLISEDLFDKLKMEDHEGEKIESISLKGKAEPINIYKIS